jgi:putative transposase
MRFDLDRHDIEGWANCFFSLEDAEGKIEAWRQDYNERRPHSALGNLAPKDFASTCQTSLAS